MIGIFIGYVLRGLYNKYFVTKWETTSFKEIELSCLNLLMISYEDYHYLKQKKEMMMHKMGVEENEIKMSKNVSEQNIASWQRTSINKFLLAIPPRFRRLVKYRTWRGAMTYLNTFRKNA